MQLSADLIGILAAVIFLLPLAAYSFMALFHKCLPSHGDCFAIGTILISLILSLVIFSHAFAVENNLLFDLSLRWLPSAAGKALSLGFMVDKLTAVMLVVVTGVSFVVYLFSLKYMENDVRYGRYYCGLLLFSTSMLGLVLANNMLSLFIFWELVGLSSYLLIGHWFEKDSANNAAIKAFITTRIGDVGMLIALLICYKQVGSLHYADLFAAVAQGTLSGKWQTIAGLGIFFGAMGKSAQFPLHVWLPDAMEGPTPISALIHAATMVAAGVYLTGRLLPLFNEPTLLFIAYTGAFTALFAATIALVQDDIKKVLAYSTLSQLGYMVMALGVGGYVAGLFHLTTHAFFKAGLFLGSGAVIYAMHHEQRLSKYGGLAKKMPWTATTYLICTLALVGLPPFSGFWSKDAILGDALAFFFQKGHFFIPLAGFVTVFLTAFYMFRQYYLTFSGKPRDKHAYDHAHEVPWQMLLPLVILAVLALCSGGLGKWFAEMNPKLSGREQVQEFALYGTKSPLMEKALLIHANSALPQTASHELSREEHEAHSTAMKLSVAFGLLGILAATLFFFERRKTGRAIFDPSLIANIAKPIYTLLSRKYYIDELYHNTVVALTFKLSCLSAAFDRLVIDGAVNFWGLASKTGAYLIELCDRIFVDGLLVNGTASSVAFIGRKLSYMQTGYLRQYIALMLFGMVLISFICIWVY